MHDHAELHGEPDASPPIELWGGVECSVVRVGDAWRDQSRDTAYHDRVEEALQLVRTLGISTLRTPFLWERLEDCQPNAPGWDWHDRQMAAVRRLGIKPIAGLLHHGSGPDGTSLLSANLPAGLATHAARVARRYPDIGWWTPVNEPLTTARFGCLYGHWYPHVQEEAAFFRAVVIQCFAALAAMRAIRACSPGARFMHTEDLGRVFATPPLAWQAGYENERRWLSLDLLCGRVDAAHPWRRRLEDCGADPRHLDALAGGEATPDLLGINHYVTSDRFLDHRLHLYPSRMHGGNGRSVYVDTEAARVDLEPSATGWAARLGEVWQRYRLPMVLSEVHLGCHDADEQLRWLADAWGAARQVRAQGADLRAATVWALFGLTDWDSLLRQRRDNHEDGALNIRGDRPRMLPLGRAVADLAHRGSFDHPALGQPGWWRRDERIHAALKRA